MCRCQSWKSSPLVTITPELLDNKRALYIRLNANVSSILNRTRHIFMLQQRSRAHTDNRLQKHSKYSKLPYLFRPVLPLSLPFPFFSVNANVCFFAPTFCQRYTLSTRINNICIVFSRMQWLYSDFQPATRTMFICTANCSTMNCKSTKHQIPSRYWIHNGLFLELFAAWTIMKF